MIFMHGMKSESEMPDGEYFVKDQFTEPEHPQQNPAELCTIKFLKDHSQVLLNWTGAPEDCWLLACEYIANDTRSHVNFAMVDFKTSLLFSNTNFMNASGQAIPDLTFG